MTTILKDIETIIEANIEIATIKARKSKMQNIFKKIAVDYFSDADINRAGSRSYARGPAMRRGNNPCPDMTLKEMGYG